MTPRSLLLALAPALLLSAPAFATQEFYVGEPVVKEGLQIVPAYLVGVEMDSMPAGMSMNKDAVHLEVDIHATEAEKHGFKEDSWIPYLTIAYTLTKDGAPTYKKTGFLQPMIAKDGPHYANNVEMGGDGTYHLTYIISPPSSHGFIRHLDKDSGVPAWWKPITANWTFTYPAKKK